MSHFTNEGFEEARTFAEDIGLTCFVYCGDMYIMDGGKRANRQNWDSYGSHSSRPATNEEQELWQKLSGS